jgi:phosphotransferase system HPr-like phosphotransfer protein
VVEKRETEMKSYFMIQDRINPKWIHEMVRKANEYEQCEIFLECHSLKVNAKSHLSVSLLNGMQGLCCVYANGEECRVAVEELRAIGTGIFP